MRSQDSITYNDENKKNTNAFKIACSSKISSKFLIEGPKAMIKLALKHV